MPESRVIYPATIAGYFEEPAVAESAAAELEQLDLGPLDPHFDRVNIFQRHVDVTPEASTSGWLSRLFGSRSDEHRHIRDDAVVLVRGAPDRLASLAEPVLRRHGAYEIRKYDTWDPQMRKPGAPGVPAQHPAR
ncbi:MAG: hypothetical protein M5U01_06575 [Ardenticatenaceae bacterium]|nr:hypothetical protein [Ardenticatenaceae bacterium]